MGGAAPEFSSVEQKLDIVIRLLALRVVQDEKNTKDKAVLLRLAGIGPSEIAGLCGTTANTINVALSQAKKKGRKSTNLATKKQATRK